MIRDRGSIKWVSLMLPEHVRLLREYNDSLDKVEKPVLDEGQLHEINDVLVQSVQDEREIKLILWFDGLVRDIETVTVYKIDPYQRKLYVRNEEGRQIFPFDSIIGAKKL